MGRRLNSYRRGPSTASASRTRRTQLSALLPQPKCWYPSSRSVAAVEFELGVFSIPLELDQITRPEPAAIPTSIFERGATTKLAFPHQRQLLVPAHQATLKVT